MPRTQHAKNKIIATAADVFYKHGYRASSIDLITKSAGITKATLYHHFQSKDHLIDEALKYMSALHRNNYLKTWSKRSLSAEQKLTALFDAMHHSFKQPDFYGCPFINAAGEYSESASSVRQICAEHYRFITIKLEQFAQDAGMNNAKNLAEQITACIAGSYSHFYVAGNKNAAKHGKIMAQHIINAHRPSPKSR